MQSVKLIKTTLLAGTVGVITGAGSGIGAAAVECFAAAGARVIYASDIIDKNLLSLNDTIRAKGYDATVVGVKTDIVKEAEVESLVRRVIKEHGRLDWFFANAGIVDFETLSSTTPAALDRMLDVNVIGAFNSVTWAARGMMNTSEGKPASGGSIIVTTSLAGEHGGTGAPAYSISKHAAVGLVRAACANLGVAGTGIRINGIAPGAVATNIAQNNFATTSDAAKQVLMKSAITPEALATLSAPEAIAQTAVFLASDMAASVNGQNIVVDRGYFQQPGSTSGLVLKPVFEPL